MSISSSSWYEMRQHMHAKGLHPSTSALPPYGTGFSKLALGVRFTTLASVAAPANVSNGSVKPSMVSHTSPILRHFYHSVISFGSSPLT